MKWNLAPEKTHQDVLWRVAPGEWHQESPRCNDMTRMRCTMLPWKCDAKKKKKEDRKTLSIRSEISICVKVMLNRESNTEKWGIVSRKGDPKMDTRTCTFLWPERIVKRYSTVVYTIKSPFMTSPYTKRLRTIQIPFSTHINPSYIRLPRFPFAYLHLHY